MNRLLPTAFAVALAAPTLSAAAAPQACAVWTKGPWTTVEQAHFENIRVGDSTSAYDLTPKLHSLARSYDGLFSGGQRARTFASDGFTVARTVDGGCSWQSTYSLDPRATPATTDPAAVLPAADSQYALKALAGAPYLPGGTAKAGQDTVVAFAQNVDSWYTGIPLNVAGQPLFVARSADGGATWHTDPFSAKLSGATVATPVLGNGVADPYVAVSAADTRSVFAVVDSRDPRALPADPSGLQWHALYVSRDGGATWSYVTALSHATGLAADPGDPNVVWTSDSGGSAEQLLAVDPRTGATRTAFTAPPQVSIRGIDVTGGPGRPTRLVLTTTVPNPATKRSDLVLYTSLDAGRHWVGVANAAASWMTLVGMARITERGDLLVVLDAGSAAVHTAGLFRWSAVTRRWTTSSLDQVPLPKGGKGFQPDDLVPTEASHRYFTIPGVTKGTATVNLLATYDSRAGR